jgi:hypothetical protein
MKNNFNNKLDGSWKPMKGSIDESGNLVIKIPKINHKKGCDKKSRVYSTKHLYFVGCSCQFEKCKINDEVGDN